MARPLGIVCPAVHPVARIQGADRAALTVGVDCDAVTIRASDVVILDHAAREDFARAYFEAVRQAGEWAARYPEAGDG